MAMGKKQLLSEKEVLKKLAKEDKKVSDKSKKNRRDAWTVVAILAVIMLLAVGLSFYKTSNIEIKEYSGRSVAKEREKAENTKKVIVGLGVLCGGILVIALVNRSKNKTSKLSANEFNKMEQKRLEDARARVEAAKRNRLNEEAMGVLGKGRSRGESFGSQSYNSSMGDRNHFNDLDIEDRAAYLERRKKEYQYYIDNDLNEEVEEQESFIGNFVSAKNVNKSTKKYLYIGLSVLAVILLAGMILILL